MFLSPVALSNPWLNLHHSFFLFLPLSPLKFPLHYAYEHSCFQEGHRFCMLHSVYLSSSHKFFSLYISYICNVKNRQFDLIYALPSRIEVWSRLEPHTRPHHTSLAFFWWLHWGLVSNRSPSSRAVQYKTW